MTTITIRDVPVEVRNELASRAGREGRSLQEYMLRELTMLASRPTVQDLAGEIADRKARYPRQIGVEKILSDRADDRR